MRKYAKRALFAGAAVLLPGAPEAKEGVRVYGIVDVNIESYSNSGGGGSLTGMRSSGRNGSRWGFMGSESLGNGTSAVFQLEGGMNVRNGQSDGRLFQRTAMVGLATDKSELVFGRLYTSAFTLAGYFTPMALGPQYESSSRFVPVRADNAARYGYRSGGLDVMAYYAFREADAQGHVDKASTRSTGGGASYKFGHYAVLALYDRLQGAHGVPGATATDNYMAGARVNLGSFKVSGTYRYRRIGPSQTGDIRSHLYSVGLGYQFTAASAVDVGYYQENFSSAPRGYLGTTDDSWRQLSLRATHDLSKRTLLYATFAHARNGPLNLGSNGDAPGPGYTLGQGKHTQRAVAAGMRHSF